MADEVTEAMVAAGKRELWANADWTVADQDGRVTRAYLAMRAADPERERRLKIAFATSLMNANAGMRWLDHDSMDEMIESAWVGFSSALSPSPAGGE